MFEIFKDIILSNNQISSQQMLSIFEHCSEKIDISIPKNNISVHANFLDHNIDYSKTNEPNFTGKFKFEYEYSIGTYYDYELEVCPCACYSIIGPKNTVTICDNFKRVAMIDSNQKKEIKYYESRTPPSDCFESNEMFEKAVLETLKKV